MPIILHPQELSVRLVEVNKDPEVETPLSQELDSLVKDLVGAVHRAGWPQKGHI
jgi:hypothetical protein